MKIRSRPQCGFLLAIYALFHTPAAALIGEARNRPLAMTVDKRYNLPSLSCVTVTAHVSSSPRPAFVVLLGP